MENKKINNWEEVKEKIKKEHSHLTEDDLIYEAGKEEELMKRLAARLDKSEEEVRNWLSLIGLR